MSHSLQIIFKQEARSPFTHADGRINWDAVCARWNTLESAKQSLANKHFTRDVLMWAERLPVEDQHRLLDSMLSGLSNGDASVGAYAMRPDDYEKFGKFFEPIIREYHKIEGDVKQQHDWNIPVGEYVLTHIDPSLEHVSMRARVARNVSGWNLPSSMSLEERLRFETMMEEVFKGLPFTGTYRSLTPGHPKELSLDEAEDMRAPSLVQRCHHRQPSHNKRYRKRLAARTWYLGKRRQHQNGMGVRGRPSSHHLHCSWK